MPELIAKFIPLQTGAVRSIPILEDAGKGNGFVTSDQDSAIIRNVPTMYRFMGQRAEDLYPSLALEALRVMQGANTYLIKWSGAQGIEAYGERTGMSSIRVGAADVHVDAFGRFQLYDSGHIRTRFVSAADVLAKRTPAARIKDQIGRAHV